MKTKHVFITEAVGRGEGKKTHPSAEQAHSCLTLVCN